MIMHFNEIKGLKVQDTDDTIYTIVDAKVFNGEMYAIGLQDSNGVVKYATQNVFDRMADVAWIMRLIPFEDAEKNITHIDIGPIVQAHIQNTLWSLLSLLFLLLLLVSHNSSKKLMLIGRWQQITFSLKYLP